MNLRYVIYLIYVGFKLAALAEAATTLAFVVPPQQEHLKKYPCITPASATTTSLYINQIHKSLKDGPQSFLHLFPDEEKIWNKKDEHEHKIPRTTRNHNNTTSIITFPNLEIMSNLQLFNHTTETSVVFIPYNSSKSLLESLTASICKVTGKDTYTFGDISIYLDSKAKTAIRNKTKLLHTLFQQTTNNDIIVNEVTSIGNHEQKDSNISILELSQRLNSNLEKYTRLVLQPSTATTTIPVVSSALPTKNIQSSIFTIQKVSRTIIRKVAMGDYQLSDITFLCKILIALGADFSPVAGLLPVKVLLELFGYSLAIDLGERFMNVLIQELDKRLQWIQDEVYSDPTSPSTSTAGASGFSYSPGDLTRQAIRSYTGKEYYQICDIRDKVAMTKFDSTQMTLMEEIVSTNAPSTTTSTTDVVVGLVGVDIIKELEECLSMERELVEKLNRIGKL